MGRTLNLQDGSAYSEDAMLQDRVDLLAFKKIMIHALSAAGIIRIVKPEPEQGGDSQDQGQDEPSKTELDKMAEKYHQGQAAAAEPADQVPVEPADQGGESQGQAEPAKPAKPDRGSGVV